MFFKLISFGVRFPTIFTYKGFGLHWVDLIVILFRGVITRNMFRGFITRSMFRGIITGNMFRWNITGNINFKGSERQ